MVVDNTNDIEEPHMSWSNVPIPDGHVVFLVVGVILHFFVPWKLFQEYGVGHLIGWAMIAVGALVAAWAVRTFADMNTKKPIKIVSSGPYAFSYNPMYVARAERWRLPHRLYWPVLLPPYRLQADICTRHKHQNSYR